MTDEPQPRTLLGRRIDARMVSLLGTLFVGVVFAIVVYRHSLFVPIYLGLITWAKIGLKSLTPKLGMLVLKNGLVIKLRDVLIGAGTRFFVTSHRPWRQRLLAFKRAVVDGLFTLYRRYLACSLWLRCLIAITLLALTASSTWVVLALLIVPQPIIEWLKKRVVVVLNKLGVLKSLDASWRVLIPVGHRARWDRYRTWTLGRRQLHAARWVRARLAPRLAVPVDAMMRASLLSRFRPSDALKPGDANPDANGPETAHRTDDTDST